MTSVRSALMLLMMGLVGCGGPAAPTDPAAAQKAGELREVYDLIALHVEQTGRPSQSAKELARLENAFPAGYESVRSGRVVVRWGVKPDPASAEVLAHEKGVATEGGYVLLASGEVKKVSAAEFDSTPKAGK